MGSILARHLSAERIAYLAQSRIPDIIACNVILLVFATGGLLIRLFVRVRYLTGINLDDLVCMTSWVRYLFMTLPDYLLIHALGFYFCSMLHCNAK
jgi:hypothetical protein